jgi:hypothetical protein
VSDGRNQRHFYMVILVECYLIVCCVMWLSTLPMYVQHVGQVNDIKYNRIHCLSLLYIYIYIAR